MGLNPSLQIPLWTWGMNSGNLKASKAERDVQIATYEKTVQSAFREVADALAAREAYLDEKSRRMIWLCPPPMLSVWQKCGLTPGLIPI